MPLEIRQGFRYHGEDWWEWWVWIEGPDGELDQVDHVVYTLHSSFPRPVREVKNRHNKFRLETSGWGVFKIYAKVVHKDNRETLLEHDLELRYPDGTLTTA